MTAGCFMSKGNLLKYHMAEFNNLYQRAIYYDIVFKRDVTSEIDFLHELYTRLNDRSPQSLLDLACGPAYHARNFAGRGLRAVGLDLRDEMLRFAADQAAAEGVTGIEWIAADMRYLNLEKPVDIALNAFDGIDCLTGNDDLIDHFKAISACLNPGGLYIIDVSPLRYTSYSHYKPWCYTGDRDGIHVEIQWATNNPAFDPITNISHTEMEIRITENGTTAMYHDSARERIVCGTEIDLLARLSGGFKICGWYGAYDFDQPVEGGERFIAVLQKVG